MRILLALLAARVCYAGSAADLARGIRETELDPEECYRVRELSLAKEDAHFYFTDGYLIFGKTVAGVRTSAIFTADVEGGDAEVIVMPPNRSERRSLASYTGSPNLNEHFLTAVLIFSDDTYPSLLAQIRANPFNRKTPEAALLLAQNWSPVVRNISTSFETRLVLDLLSRDRKRGFFASAISGKQLGNFDVVYDPRAREQIVIGQMTHREDRPFFDLWTSFETRTSRAREVYGPEFVLKDYRIEATLDPDLLLRALTRVKIAPSPDGTRVLPFDIGGQMRISEVLINGEPAEILHREAMRSNLIRNTGNELFLVIPPAPLEPGREYEVELHHEGRVVADAGNRVYYVGARGSWYPNRGMQFAAYDLTFRYPKDLDLVTTGDVVEERTEGEWRVTRRRTSSPIRLAGFNLGIYERARITRSGYAVDVYANRGVESALQPKPREPIVLPPPVTAWPRQRRTEIVTLPPELPPNPRSRLQELASEIATALEFMADRFGPPPLRTLTVSPVPGAFGQGFPGLIYLSTLSYLGRQEKPIASLSERQQTFFAAILYAHEVAHQWWGNVVTAAGYHDEWLMEALANYSALMFIEKSKSPRTLDSILEDYKNSLLAKQGSGQTVESTGPIVMGPRLETSQGPRAWRAITYGKGSWIVHMLRRAMGDERFQSMLHELRRRYERKPLTTEEFRQLAAEFLPSKSPDSKLEAFFDQWVYGTGIPAFKLTHSVRGRIPNLKVTGTIAQSDVDPDFSTMVPIDIQFGRGKAITHWVRSGSEPVSFSVPIRQLPTKVTVDANSRILHR